MCLEKIDKKYDKPHGHAWHPRWKVLEVEILPHKGRMSLERDVAVCTVDQKEPIEVGKVQTASIMSINDDLWSMQYPSGWHGFCKREGAVRWLNLDGQGVVVKVLLRGLLAKGIQNDRKCEVYRYLRLEKRELRKAVAAIEGTLDV